MNDSVALRSFLLLVLLREPDSVAQSPTSSIQLSILSSHDRVEGKQICLSLATSLLFLSWGLPAAYLRQASPQMRTWLERYGERLRQCPTLVFYRTHSTSFWNIDLVQSHANFLVDSSLDVHLKSSIGRSGSAARILVMTMSAYIK